MELNCEVVVSLCDLEGGNAIQGFAYMKTACCAVEHACILPRTVLLSPPSTSVLAALVALPFAIVARPLRLLITPRTSCRAVVVDVTKEASLQHPSLALPPESETCHVFAAVYCPLRNFQVRMLAQQHVNLRNARRCVFTHSRERALQRIAIRFLGRCGQLYPEPSNAFLNDCSAK